jgi:formate hydrogenlyase transcriptional activator
LFLDEIGEIPLEVQPKLLRVLQEREFERLGSTRTLRSDVRLIAATNRNLEAMTQENKFRADLFFGLNDIPSLRKRLEDIPLLVRHFAQEFSRRMNKKMETIPSGMMKALCDYDWPGNVRELQNVIERAVILSSGTTLIVPNAELRDRRTGPSEIDKTAPSERRMPVRSILADVDRDELIPALAETRGRIGGRNGAAAHLGLRRTTFITRMKKLGIDRNQVLQVDEVTVDTSGTPKIDQEI